MPETIPSKTEIDALAELYNDAREKRKAAAELEDLYKGQLSDMVDAFGFLPPRATKSKRLLGVKWKITAGNSSSVEVDGTQVLRFRDVLKSEGIRGIFSKLFNRESVYVLRPGAELVAAKRLAKSELSYSFFNSCLDIKDRGETLDVVLIEDKKKAKKTT